MIGVVLIEYWLDDKEGFRYEQEYISIGCALILFSKSRLLLVLTLDQFVVKSDPVHFADNHFTDN